MSSIVYLNGKYLPLEKASVNVQDRGFIFGDGVYEVIPVISGVPIDTEIHIQRMYSSLSKIDIGTDKLADINQINFIIQNLRR